jgi:hypothetical protein
MSQIGTTSIDSLPVADVDVAVANDTISNVHATEKNVILDDKVKQLQEHRKQLDSSIAPVGQHVQLNVNEFVSGIQKASTSGALRLPSRDIPQDTLTITNDEQVHTNFVPQSSNLTTDYITEHQTTEDILRLNARKQSENETLDKIYSEISLPLMIAVFYFLYQLPIVRKTLFNTFPMCYTKGGDMNMTGFLLNSAVFGLAVYGTHKLVKYLS